MGCVNCKCFSRLWNRITKNRDEKKDEKSGTIREEIILAGPDRPEPLQKMVSDSSIISPSELRDVVPPEISVGKDEDFPGEKDVKEDSKEDSVRKTDEPDSKSEFSKIENETDDKAEDKPEEKGKEPTSDSDWQDINN